MLSGIFVGGRSRRMAGYPKALLRSGDGETLIARAIRVARAAGLTPCLVGEDGAVRRAEPALAEVPTVPDAAPGRGPLGGLLALLDAAHGAPTIALACDMPRVDEALLRRLAEAPDAPIVAPRRAGRWEPLCARYDAARVRPIAARHLEAGVLALQALLDVADAMAIDLEDDARLDDVDTEAEAVDAGLTRRP